MHWWTKAAEQGNDVAQDALARMYLSGEGGVKQDTQHAIFWFRKAADQGLESAIETLNTLQ